MNTAKSSVGEAMPTPIVPMNEPGAKNVNSKPAKPKKEEEPEPEPLPPLDERINRLNELFALQSKYNKLLETRQKLNDFIINKSEETFTLSIGDRTRGNDFSTTNSVAIKEVINCIKNSLDEMIKTIEPKLKW